MSLVHQPAFRPSLLAPRFWPLWLALLLYALVTLVPKRLRAVLAAAASAVLWRLPSRRRDIARVNLGLCFPQLSRREREDILRRHAAIVANVFLDYGVLLFGAARVLARMTAVAGREHFEQARRAGRNVIVLCPHVAALEHVGQWLVLQQEIVSVARLHQDNALLDWLVTRMRSRRGGQVFSNRGNMVPVIRAVRNGAWLYLLPDEDQGEAGLVFAPFYGVAKATTPSLARLARACNALVLPMAGGYCVASRRYWLRFLPPVELEPTGDPVRDAANSNALLQRIIDVDPAQYMWSGKIFRTRPAGTANPYKQALS